LLSRESGPDAPIGLVHRGAVYFKVGPESVTRYIAAGMRPFRPGPRQALRGYWRVPEDVLADPPALCVWARAATESALRFGGRRRARAAQSGAAPSAARSTSTLNPETSR
jgi:TfoX/Sxy family transcriptional regulator of competence genes